MSNKLTYLLNDIKIIFIEDIDYNNNRIEIDLSKNEDIQEYWVEQISLNTKIEFIITFTEIDITAGGFVSYIKIPLTSSQEIYYDSGIDKYFILLDQNITLPITIGNSYTLHKIAYINVWLYPFNNDGEDAAFKIYSVINEDTEEITYNITGDYDTYSYFSTTDFFKIGYSKTFDFTTPEYKDFEKLISLYIKDYKKGRILLTTDIKTFDSGWNTDILTFKTYWYNPETSQWEETTLNTNDIDDNIGGYRGPTNTLFETQYNTIEEVSEHINQFIIQYGNQPFRFCFLGNSVYSNISDITIDYYEERTEEQKITIYGTLIDASTQPLSNKPIYIHPYSTQVYGNLVAGGTYIKTMTNENGYFEFKVLPNTNYIVILPNLGKEIIINAKEESIDISEKISNYLTNYRFNYDGEIY